MIPVSLASRQFYFFCHIPSLWWIAVVCLLVIPLIQHIAILIGGSYISQLKPGFLTLYPYDQRHDETLTLDRYNRYNRVNIYTPDSTPPPIKIQTFSAAIVRSFWNRLSAAKEEVFPEIVTLTKGLEITLYSSVIVVYRCNETRCGHWSA